MANSNMTNTNMTKNNANSNASSITNFFKGINPFGLLDNALSFAYEKKQHRNVLLLYIITSFGFIGWRTLHFLGELFGIHGFIAVSAMIMIELAALAVSAGIINTRRIAYNAEKRNTEDKSMAQRIVFIANSIFYILMTVLVIVAFYDAFILSNDNWIAGGLFAGLQVVFLGIYVIFISMADIEQRVKIRNDIAIEQAQIAKEQEELQRKLQEQERERQAQQAREKEDLLNRTCSHCGQVFTRISNKVSHEEKCKANPKNR